MNWIDSSKTLPYDLCDKNGRSHANVWVKLHEIFNSADGKLTETTSIRKALFDPIQCMWLVEDDNMNLVPVNAINTIRRFSKQVFVSAWAGIREVEHGKWV